MSIQRRVKSLERRLSQGGPMLAIVTLEEHDAMVRDACERVLASQPDDRTRALVDAVLGASNWTLVTEERKELNLRLRPPARYSDWPPGKPFRWLLDYREATSVEEWLAMVHREKARR